MCHENHILVHDTQIISEEGDYVTDIGEQEVDTSESTLFDPNTDYDTRTEGFDSDIESDYHDSLDTSSSGGWFGDMFDGGDSGSFDGDSSCSSCSSCGGCD